MLPRSILRITQHHRRIMTTTPLVHLNLRGKIVAFMKRLPAQLIHSDESIRLIPLAVELMGRFEPQRAAPNKSGTPTRSLTIVSVVKTLPNLRDK